MKHRYTLKRVLKVLDTLEEKFSADVIRPILVKANAIEVRELLNVSSTHESAHRGRWVIVDKNSDEVWLMTMRPDPSDEDIPFRSMQFQSQRQAQAFIDKNWEFWLKFKQSYLALRLL